MHNLILSEIKKELIEMRRYWFNTVTSSAFFIILFVLFFYGFKMFLPIQTDSLDQMIIVYIFWLVALSGVQISSAL